MNNGKIRIYELSRELNLDNKDLLNICEGLNIAVKSHSSTITESDVQRIRAAAEKYTESPSAVKHRDGATTAEGSPKSPLPQKLGRPNPQQKQQILSLKPKSRPSSSYQQGNTQLATPPQPPVKPNVNPPRPPVNVTRPNRVTQADKLSELVDESDAQVLEERPTTPSIEEKPQLVQPPSRQMSQKQQAAQVERPVLKRARQESSDSVPSGIQTPTKSPSTKSPRTPSESKGPVRGAPTAAPVPKLQAPPRRATAQVGAKTGVSKPGAAQEGGSDDEEVLFESPDDILKEVKLRRPTPPKQVKKKEWEDEEEEGKDKAGKAAGKVKRRPKLIEDEEDEDLVAGLQDIGAASMLSEAVLRPTKPKSRPTQSVATPTVTQKKKPTAKGSGSSSSKSENRDRNNRDKKAVPERPDKVVLTDSLTVRELAAKLEIAETEIIKKLFFKGMAVNITQTLDLGTASMVAEELGVEVETAQEEAPATKVTEMLDAGDMENLLWRPPVVTIMGHVDHGKTTLLDAIRATKVAQGEAGGITQHIGAYHVDVEHEGATQQVVFLDTPGHEAFTAMRARGARVTDIAILVVAADDGVRPQTIEAISHAKAAEVPIIVAINKIDKAEAQPDRVKQELTEYGLVPEEWGGETIMVPVSAIQKENLDTLLEMILLVAEVQDLQANPNRAARGTVIEANLDKSRGPVATLLVQNGSLRVGDTLVAGSVFGKVRAMIDDRGAKVEAAYPSFAVEILGLSELPAAGDEFEVFTEKEARAIADKRADEQRMSRLQQLMSTRRVTLNSLSAKAQEGELKELNLILKADVQGSAEAILGALKQLPQNEVQIRVLFSAAGEISETDVDLAAASGAVVIGFNTTLAHGARQAADREGVDVREYNIIYNLLDEIQGAMEGLLEPEMVEEALGEVEVRAVFPVGRGAVAGCYVLSGKAIRNCHIRVRRNSKVIYEGILDSLKRMKDDVKEVNAGYECGIGLDKFNGWMEKDIIETFKMVSKRRTLSLT